MEGACCEVRLSHAGSRRVVFSGAIGNYLVLHIQLDERGRCGNAAYVSGDLYRLAAIRRQFLLVLGKICAMRFEMC